MNPSVIRWLPLFVLALASASAAIPDPLPKAPEPVDDILRLQIFLDTQLFGPGKVDGRPGEFTTKALKRYQTAHGLPETDLATHSLDLSSVPENYTTYTIRPEDLKFIGDLPSQPSAQSKKKYLPYDSILEFLTERFHCSPEFLEHVNQPLKVSSLKPGDTLKVPAVQPFLIEELTQIASLPEIPEFLTRVIKIDTREKLLGLYEGEKLLASLPITPGSGHLATPPGSWRIVGIAQLPTFRWDKSVLEYGVRSSNYYELPIGPNNPVGVMWIGLSKAGIGIHGTNSPQTIGRSASHGCMRTANWDVVRLARLITKGMPVIIEGPAPTPRAVYAKADTKKPSPASTPPPQPNPWQNRSASSSGPGKSSRLHQDSRNSRSLKTPGVKQLCAFNSELQLKMHLASPTCPHAKGSPQRRSRRRSPVAQGPISTPAPAHLPGTRRH